MRAQFIRGDDPKDTMDIGAYRTDAPKKDIFKRMHELAEKCPLFSNVTEINWDRSEPTFKIYSTKTHKKTPSIYKEEFTLYLTNEEGGWIIMFDDVADSEYADLTLKEFLKITSCKPIKESLDFERGGDPIKQMGLGIGSLTDLRPGNILKAKYHLKIEDHDKELKIFPFAQNQNAFPHIGNGAYIVVVKADYIEEAFRGSIVYVTFSNQHGSLDLALKRRESYRRGEFIDKRFEETFWTTVKLLKNRFEFIK